MTGDRSGRSLRRLEDRRFLTGQGQYVDDVDVPGQLNGVVLRSPHGHALIEGIDAAAARAMPGVHGVFIAADLDSDGIGPLPCIARVATVAPMIVPPRWALARDRVRHVGEPVAVVLAETLAQARDAAELVQVDYEPLPAVIDAKVALGEGAPQLHDAAPSNICFRFARGDDAAVRKIIAAAPHVVRLDLINNRLIGAAIEPRAVLADGGASGKLTLYCATQVPHHIRRAVSEQLNLPQTAIRLMRLMSGAGSVTRVKLSRRNHRRMGGTALASTGEMGRHTQRVLCC